MRDQTECWSNIVDGSEETQPGCKAVTFSIISRTMSCFDAVIIWFITWLTDGQSQTWENVSCWDSQLGQSQLLYKSGRLFFICSMVGSSSIKYLTRDFFFDEAKNEVDERGSSLSKAWKVECRSTSSFLYFVFRCKLNHLSKPEFLKRSEIKWQRWVEIWIFFHTGITC